MHPPANDRLNLVSVPLRIKGTFLPATLLQPAVTQPARFRAGLAERISQGGALLQTAPVVLDLAQVTVSDSLQPWVEACRELQVQLVAVRTDVPELQQQARELGLVALNGSERSAPAANQEEVPRTKIHQGTVRGGQQLLCETGDLVIMGSVNPGAEVLASGHVHVYGALRGRVLAGIHGDRQARIFTQQLDAELVAIAGHYQTSQAADWLHRGVAGCIALEQEQLVFSSF
ncbi:septum site-determining protein MinC [Marinospirillum alkaliphilum]|uniref:Probable septum site-determining protein MinC n=1 Tax=Marinospirillum alkaliphilum DSM 21637 TaxID=1122209 RepID=A0A1K1ZTW8_9GAMM|nr:septum site-determining protein MinC [Marinospirillum alkaliphilum]SFX77646.1 septum site-determining protein MinC [Marinospirillum alkaliphilum DSM 21637]